jgi:hypothetical protein
LATTEATHNTIVVQRSRAVREQQRREVFKRGNIDREATEVLLMEALHKSYQRLWRSTFDVLPGTSSISLFTDCRYSPAGMVTLRAALVAAGQRFETSWFTGYFGTSVQLR